MPRKFLFLPLLIVGLLLLVPYVRSAPSAPPTLGGCPVFPASNIWNVPVDNLPVAANSAAYINTIGGTTSLHPDFGANWNGGPFGIPFIVVSQTQPLVNIHWTAYGDESDLGPYPVPTAAPIEGGPASDGDRHVLVMRQGECKLYELYRAFPNANGSWDADSGAVYTLTLNGPLRPDGWTSADAAGLPILPGLVRYDEVASGEIRHALRFTANLTQKAHVWPARHDASASTNLARPPMGQRFRLKASVDISAYPAQIQVIFRALKTYGLILADNGSNWYISGAPDARWDDDMLVTAFRSLKGNDFEAVDVSSLMVDPDSGQVLTDFALTLSPAARAIDPGSATSYQLTTDVRGYWTGPVTITTHSPSPSVTIGLSGSIAAAVVPVPGAITLLVTDTHPIGSPAIWYSIPISATGSGVAHVVSAGLLIGGMKVYLPLVLKN